MIYIPEICAAKGGCRLHIALHGCEQNRDQVGMAFIEGSGFAGWADTNNLVILFPQVEASILNPKACWDRFCYTGNNFLTKDALQIAAIWRMVERLASGNKTANVSAAPLIKRTASVRACTGTPKTGPSSCSYLQELRRPYAKRHPPLRRVRELT